MLETDPQVLPDGLGNKTSGGNGPVDSLRAAQYSIPGILHFIQHEWARFEMERAHWEVERAELQARIAFLQGERKGQENLKRDLIRRIKMLEFALRKERQKFHKLKYGTELTLPEINDTEGEEELKNDVLGGKNHDLVFNYRQGRQLLRQYLQEIGYTDKVLEIRGARIRSLLGINTDDLHSSDGENKVKKNKRTKDETEVGHTTVIMADEDLLDGNKQTEDSETGDVDVLKDFDFLGQEELRENESVLSNETNVDEWSGIDSNKLQQKIKQFKNDTKDRGKKKRGSKETLSMYAEEDIPPPPQSPAPPVPPVKPGDEDDEIPLMGEPALPSSGFSPRQVKPGMMNHSGVADTSDSVALGLGDLADLTVANDASSNDMSTDEIRKTWGPKYTLRSHFDGVRSICFHPYEAALITGSEDHTLKFWSLKTEKNVQGKKGNISDLEPVYTFRAHTGAVLCSAINSNGSMCFSAGVDTVIQCWNLPSLNIDLFGPYDPNLLGETLRGHTDSIWDLAYHIDTDRLLSCSADGTCKLWNPSAKSPLLESYIAEDSGAPTSASFINTDTGQIAASFACESCVVFDLETGKPVITFTPEKGHGGPSYMNKVISHPTLPLLVTAHEDRHIRFFDINSGKEVHNMVAHLDSVTSLSIDPSGLYILSGSHDGSIRLWNMENKTCIQEITAHRKKFDEAVFDVAFHPSQPYIASAGADALAKVFV